MAMKVKSLGGKVIHILYKIGNGWIASLADLAGNYFQLLNPMS